MSPSSLIFGLRLQPVLAALLVLALSASGLPAHAQTAPASGLTAKTLIGDSVSNPKADRYSDIAEAIKRFQNRDQLSARTFLERAVQKDSKLPPVGVLLAKMQLLSGNGAAVRPALEQAVQEDSATDPEPFLLLGEEALASGRTIEADALFDKAAALIETYDVNSKRKRKFIIRAYRGRAVIAERRENWEQAEADLRKWLEEDPEASPALSRLGQVLFMLGKPTEGYQAFVDAKKLNENLPSPHVSAALMHSRKGETNQAMLSFEKAFGSDPGDEKTLVAYAQALVKARDTFQSGLGAKESPSECSQLRQRMAAERRGRTYGRRFGATAESHLLCARSALAPSNRDTMNQLAQTLVESDRFKSDRTRALQFCYDQRTAQSLLIRTSTSPTLGSCSRTARENWRRKPFARLLQGGALSPDGSFLLAKMLLARNDKTNAKRLLESAMKNDQGIFVQKEQAEVLLQDAVRKIPRTEPLGNPSRRRKPRSCPIPRLPLAANSTAHKKKVMAGRSVALP